MTVSVTNAKCMPCEQNRKKEWDFYDLETFMNFTFKLITPDAHPISLSVTWSQHTAVCRLDTNSFSIGWIDSMSLTAGLYLYWAVGNLARQPFGQQQFFSPSETYYKLQITPRRLEVYFFHWAAHILVTYHVSITVVYKVYKAVICCVLGV